MLADLDANLTRGVTTGDHGRQMLEAIRKLRPNTVVIGESADPFPTGNSGARVDFDCHASIGPREKIGLYGQALARAVANTAR